MLGIGKGDFKKLLFLWSHRSSPPLFHCLPFLSISLTPCLNELVSLMIPKQGESTGDTSCFTLVLVRALAFVCLHARGCMRLSTSVCAWSSSDALHQDSRPSQYFSPRNSQEFTELQLQGFHPKVVKSYCGRPERVDFLQLLAGSESSFPEITEYNFIGLL